MIFYNSWYSRSCQDLLPGMGHKLIPNMFYSNETIFKQVTNMKDMVVAAQLFTLRTLGVGGIILPAHSLVLTSLQPLLHYEAVLAMPDHDEAGLVVGGHSSARLWQVAITMFLQEEERKDNIITEAADRFPNLVTKIGEEGLRFGGGQVRVGGGESRKLLLRRDLEGLRELYKYNLVIMDKEDMEKNALARRDNLGTILRTLWKLVN